MSCPYCYGHCHCRRPYGIVQFIFDCFMVVITGGWWLIWILVRELRRR